MKKYIYTLLTGFFIGVVGTALLFNQIITKEHNVNRSLYQTLNKCDQSLKVCLNKL